LFNATNEKQDVIIAAVLCDWLIHHLFRATARVAMHGVAKAFLSVCLSNRPIVTKRKKLVPIFLYYMKDHSS